MRLSPIFASFVLIFVSTLSVVSADHADRGAALGSINESEEIISELSEAGFGVSYFEGLLVSQRKALERADLAESLRSGDGSLPVVTVRALEALDYEKFSYDDVLAYAQEMSERRTVAYDIHDSIRALEIRIGSYRQYGIDMSAAEAGLSNARELFGAEDYDGSESAVDAANADLDERRAGMSNVKLFLNSGTNFVESNKYTMVSVLIAAVLVTIVAWRLLAARRVRVEIRKLRLEEKVVEKLMRELQVRRFEKSSIPRSVYSIRMEKYRKRLNEIKQRLPILEGRR